MRIALFEPDIPQNTGSILRLGACLGVAVDLVEPAGFRTDDRALKRAGMDYLEIASLKRHTSWTSFDDWRRTEKRRLILFTTHARMSFLDFTFDAKDVLMFGRESSGVPETVHTAADARLLIPMAANTRSLNLALSVAMATTEALRQIDAFPSVERIT